LVKLFNINHATSSASHVIMKPFYNNILTIANRFKKNSVYTIMSILWTWGFTIKIRAN